MGDDDGDETAAGIDPFDGLVVEEGDAVPKNVAGGGGDEDCTLGDGEAGVRGDGG